MPNAGARITPGVRSVSLQKLLLWGWGNQVIRKDQRLILADKFHAWMFVPLKLYIAAAENPWTLHTRCSVQAGEGLWAERRGHTGPRLELVLPNMAWLREQHLKIRPGLRLRWVISWRDLFHVNSAKWQNVKRLYWGSISWLHRTGFHSTSLFSWLSLWVAISVGLLINLFFYYRVRLLLFWPSHEVKSLQNRDFLSDDDHPHFN